MKLIHTEYNTDGTVKAHKRLRAKVLDEVEEWYWRHGYNLWELNDYTRSAQRELKSILFPYGGGDVS